MKKVLFYLFFLLTTPYLYAQTTDVIKETSAEMLKQEITKALELYKAKNYQEALLIFEKYKEILLEGYKNDSETLLTVLTILETCYVQTSQAQKAEEIKDRKNKLPGQQNENWKTLNKKGIKFYEQGKYQDAITEFEKAKNQAEKEFGKQDSNYAQSCSNLAALYESQGFYAQAELLCIESKQIRLEFLGKEHPDYAQSCSNLALLYTSQGFYAKAEPLLMEAKAIRLKVFGTNHPTYASSCNSLASLYESQGLYAQAEPLYTKAKEIRLNVLGKNHPDYASSCNNLAALYYGQGLYSKAESLYIEAKEIRLKVLGNEHPDYTISCNNLALLYKKQHLYDKAEPLYVEAKEIQLKILGKDHPYYALSCNNLAQLYEKQGLYGKAETLYIEAKEIRLKILGKMHPDYAVSCNNLAALYDDKDLYAQAEPLYIEAKEIVLQSIQSNFTNLSEQEKQQYWLSNKVYFENFYLFISKILGKQPEYNLQNLLQNSINLQLQTKAIILGETQKMKKRILASKDTSLIAQFEKWHNLKNNIAKAHNLSFAEREKKEIDMTKLENEANIAEKKLAAKSADFAKAFTPPNYTYKDLQKKLKKNEVALEIIKVAGNLDYLVIFVTKKDLQVIKLGNAYELESKFFKQYRNNISYKIADKNSYNNFWKPFLPYLKKAKKVYFCPDGVYNQLSLNTLQNPETNKFLGEETKITIVGNLKDIFQESSNNPNKTAELFGRPDYKKGNNKDNKQGENNNENKGENKDENKDRSLDNDRNFASFSSIKKSSFADLAGTETEIKGIASNLSQQNYKVGLFLGADAVEEQVKTTNSPKILHISTHGYFVPSDSKNKINGMLSSGIVLAGVSDTIENIGKEDGVLTAYEASTLDLDNTDLVVLSACETGLGEVATGEGVYGLQRGFKVAGADAVLISLWKVDDKATQELMTIFYTNWLKTGNKQQALLDAQASLREKYKFPYYWGAFVLVGE